MENKREQTLVDPEQKMNHAKQFKDFESKHIPSEIKRFSSSFVITRAPSHISERAQWVPRTNVHEIREREACYKQRLMSDMKEIIK